MDQSGAIEQQWPGYSASNTQPSTGTSQQQQQTLNPPAASTSQVPADTTERAQSSDFHQSGRRKGSGRPKDPVWALFNGDAESASCSACGWSCEKPKAFRMREHILDCSSVNPETRAKMQASEEARKVKAEAKKAAKRSHSDDENSPDLSVDGAGLMSTPIVQPAKKAKMDTKQAPKAPSTSMAAQKSPITCHVLDATIGKPAPNIMCRLDRLSQTGFVVLAQGSTDNDGRCNNLLTPGTTIEPGVYKMTFLTREFFDSKKVESFYPFVEIPFEIKDVPQHYHIPLLLSPFAYSTYRGS